MALEALKQAHRRGEAMLAHLERALASLDREGRPLEPIDEFLAFCDGELEAHFSQEEESLFPRLERAIGPGWTDESHAGGAPLPMEGRGRP
ncbi:MAG: hemerythrin domain-containing protein [Chloroflexi bacterium]|nr:hemerythrin domain-containing protein [Chloroflexota bacterium]